MAESLMQSQGEDGFWRSSLLDPDEYPDPESSGTAFFTYGLAWGINNGNLDKESITRFNQIVGCTLPCRR
ncbi:MAG: glycoside hydrolase family 88 protein [Bacteroidales bacterium]